MTTHEVLVAAKSYLLNYGWRQNSYGEHGSPRCMLGAVGSVFGIQTGDSDEFDSDQRQDWMAVPYAALRDQTNACVPNWNDEDGRTLGEVIAAFDRAILATAPPLDDTPIFQALETLPAEDYIECLSVLALIPAGALA